MVPFSDDPRKLIDAPWTFVSDTEVVWSVHPSVLHRIVASVRGIMGVVMLVGLTIAAAEGGGRYDWVWPSGCALCVWGLGTGGALWMSYAVLGGVVERETTGPSQQGQDGSSQGGTPSPTSTASPAAGTGRVVGVQEVDAARTSNRCDLQSTSVTKPPSPVTVVVSPPAAGASGKSDSTAPRAAVGGAARG